MLIWLSMWWMRHGHWMKNDQKILNLVLDKKAIILLNKTDLETVVSKEMLAEQLLGREIPMIEISAKEELGIQELEKTLEKNVFKGQSVL